MDLERHTVARHLTARVRAPRAASLRLIGSRCQCLVAVLLAWVTDNEEL